MLRDRAREPEELRRLPDETVSDLRAAGLHKLFTPKRFGGFEMPWGTYVDVSRMLGQSSVQRGVYIMSTLAKPCPVSAP